VIEVRTGHNLELLQAMPSKSVQCCITSPPYWGLRDYGDPGKEWPEVSFSPMPGLPEMTVPASCEPLGLEADPWAYVGHLVALFREVRRVLADDGVLFLNLGDSYNAQQGQQRLSESSASTRGGGHKVGSVEYRNTRRPTPDGLKPKDLVGIPWRAAFALQADGWYLRSDVIWAKPNPMPESVRDRPTKAHEYVFILAKQGRYFWDQEATREAQSPGTAGRYAEGYRDRYADGAVDAKGYRGAVGGSCGMTYNSAGRNPRTVWTIPTQPYPGAHFAVWPPELAARCIKAGTSAAGCCSECKAPRVRVVVEKGAKPPAMSHRGGQRAAGSAYDGSGSVRHMSGQEFTRWKAANPDKTAWAPSCECNAETIPCTVLDPFGGSGTTGLVAREHGRSCVLLEQSPTYADMARARLGQAPADVATAKDETAALPLFGGGAQ
jgi:DNA modification methylase